MRIDEAAERGDVHALLQELGEQPALLRRGRHSYSALHRAAERGHVDAVQTLLRHGADAPGLLNGRTREGGHTPLHLAAQRGSIGVVRKLLDTPALEVDARNEKGLTASQLAEYAGHSHVATLLLSPRKAALSPAAGGHPSEGEPPLSPAMARLERDAQALRAERSSSSGELSPLRQALKVEQESEVLRHSLAEYPGSPRRAVSACSPRSGIGAASRHPSRLREASQRWQLEVSAHNTVTDGQRKAQHLAQHDENVIKSRTSSVGAARVTPSTGLSEDLRRHRERSRTERTALEGQRIQRNAEHVTRKHTKEAPPSPVSELSPVATRLFPPAQRQPSYSN